MKELKPCPFCGGKANYYCEELDWADWGYISATKYYNTYVECEECGAGTASFDTEQQAIDAWNRREK